MDGLSSDQDPGLDVGEVVVEPAQVVVVLLVVQSREDAAAGQLRQILEEREQTYIK